MYSTVNSPINYTLDQLELTNDDDMKSDSCDFENNMKLLKINSGISKIDKSIYNTSESFMVKSSENPSTIKTNVNRITNSSTQDQSNSFTAPKFTGNPGKLQFKI